MLETGIPEPAVTGVAANLPGRKHDILSHPRIFWRTTWASAGHMPVDFGTMAIRR